MELLWRDGGGEPARGLSVDAIVRAGIEVADAEGLAGLSMRKVAERLGFTTMSLYRHVPSRDHLVDLMRDAAIGELPPAGAASGPWREELESCLRQSWELRRRHPWLAEVRGARHLPGPNAVAVYDRLLGILSSAGLAPAETVAAADLLGRFVDAEALRLVEIAAAERASGVSEEEWWGSKDSLYDRLGAYPALTALWEAGAWDDPPDSFEFGLARLLDGISLLIGDETRDETCRICGTPLPRPTTGRPRAYCSRACRQRAYRARHAR